VVGWPQHREAPDMEAATWGDHVSDEEYAAAPAIDD
jgi:hypothetical protein